ncbi:MAG: OmpA family protein [Bacteroidota bacterium]
MEIRKIILSISLLGVSFLALSQWAPVQKPDWSQSFEQFQLCDIKNGKVLFLSQRLAQVMGQGTMFESKISRLHEYDIFTGRERTLFPKDWNFPEGHACYGKSNNEVFYESKILPNGTNGRWSKIHIYSKSDNQQFGERLRLLNFDQDGFDCIHPVFIENLNLLVFSSNRAGGLGGFDLYGSYRMDSIWSPVFSLGSEVNTSSNECFPSVHGNELFFTRMSENGNSQCYRVPLNTQFLGVHPLTEFNGFTRLVPFGTNQMYAEKEMKSFWYEQVQKKETYSLLLTNETGKLSQISVRIERNDGFDFFISKTNEKGFTEPFQFSANEKVKISLQGNWQSLQMPIYGTLYSSKGNQIRRYKFNASGVIQFELLDFIFSNVNFLTLHDESQLIDFAAPARAENKLILYFQKNQSTIDRSGQVLIETWMKQVNPNKFNGTYEVKSFCSSDGSAKRNMKLAQDRLNASQESLLKLGVYPSQIEMQIGGIMERIDGGRRVEIEFIPLQEVTD